MSANPELQNWQIVENLFHEMLELAPEKRESYLRARAISPEIIAQVQSLLASLDAGDEYLEHQSLSFSGVIQQAVQELASDLSNLQNGPRSPGPAAPSPSHADNHDSDRGLALLLSRKRQAETPRDISEWSRHVPDYELQRLINRGGMGTVFAAWDPKLRRSVAIKIIAGKQVDARVYRQFIRESSAAAKLNSDHVVTIHAIGDQTDFPYLVMELIDGPSLKQWIAEKGAADPQTAAQVIRQAALGLNQAHVAGLIHRDIKPANILLAPVSQGGFPWRVKLIDFGLARSLDRDQWESSDHLIAGTPAYMCPEQLTSPEHIDQRADIYGLGATLYQLLTGIPPFQGPTLELLRRIQFEEPISPRRLNPSIPVDLNSICLKALSKDAQARYATAAQFAEDLQRFLDGRSTLARPVSWLRRGLNWVRRHPRSAVVNATLVGLALMLVIGSIVTAQLLAAKNQLLSDQQQVRWRDQVKRIADANPGALTLAIEAADLKQTEVREQLQAILGNVVYDRQAQVNAAVALAGSDSPPKEHLLAATYESFCSPWQCQNLIAAIRKIPPISQAEWLAVWNQIESQSLPANAAREARVRVAIVAAHAGEPGLLAKISDRLQENPQDRTALIHLLPQFHPSCSDIADYLGKETQGDILFAYCCGISQMLETEYSVADRLNIQQSLQALIGSQDDPGVVAAASFALIAWGGTPNLLDRTEAGAALWRPVPDVNLIQVAPDKRLLGRLNPDILHEGHPPHEVEITRSFYLADREINWRAFKRFLSDEQTPDSEKPVEWRDVYSQIVSQSDLDDLPATQVSWYDAILYCNWLSKQCRLTPVYQFSEPSWELPVEQDSPEHIKLPRVVWDRDANGFRLPTEAEWEMACRAHSSTDYHFGNDEQLIPHYINVSNYRRKPLVPGGSLLPNRFGFYEMHGNVWEWCFDWYSDLNTEPQRDPSGPVEFLADRPGKVYRGGGVAQSSGDPGSGARGRTLPNSRFFNLGFRIAR